MDENGEYINKIRNDMFYMTMSKEVGDYVLQTFARALAGDCLKMMLMFVGGTNSGKSTLCNALKKACGSCATSFDGKNLVKGRGSGDSAQRMRPFLLDRFALLLMANEMSEDDIIDSALFKGLCGKDGIEGRVHGGLETKFNMHSLMVMFSNDVLKFSSMDSGVTERIRILYSMYSFVDNPDPNNKFELKRDPELIKSFDTLEFQQTMVRILIIAYKDFLKNGEFAVPEEMKLFKKISGLSEEKNGIIGSFLQEFTPVPNASSYVISDDITQFICEYKLGCSKTKLAMEIKKYCLLNDIPFHGTKKMYNPERKQNCNYWIGIARGGKDEKSIETAKPETEDASTIPIHDEDIEEQPDTKRCRYDECMQYLNN
jgi:hypothetical protein